MVATGDIDEALKHLYDDLLPGEERRDRRTKIIPRFLLTKFQDFFRLACILACIFCETGSDGTGANGGFYHQVLL
jgi:hypothetical protein